MPSSLVTLLALAATLLAAPEANARIAPEQTGPKLHRSSPDLPENDYVSAWPNFPIEGNSEGRSRWLSEDPIGEEGGLNLYAYVDNRPSGLIDPKGLHWVEDYLLRPIENAGDWLYKKLTGRPAQPDVEKVCDFFLPLPGDEDYDEADGGHYGPLVLSMLPGGVGKFKKGAKALAACEKAAKKKKLSKARRVAEKGRTQQATELKEAQDAARKRGERHNIESTKRSEQEERAAWRRGEYE